MESYSASHPETLEELLEWPWQRFNACYEAWSKRELIEQLTRRKDMIVAALHGNGYMTGEQLNESIENLEENLAEARRFIYNGRTQQDEVVIEGNPFFDAMVLPEIQESSMQNLSKQPKMPRGLAEDDYKIDVDQN